MSIDNLSAEDFRSILYGHISPAAPIRSYEHLYGRNTQLQKIEQELSAPGRSIFIYGDRGVGKTSLAQTAAHSLQSSDNKPIFKACSRKATFFQIVQSIAQDMVRNPIAEERTKSQKTSIGIPHFGYEMQSSITQGKLPEIVDINIAATLLKQIAPTYSSNTLCVIDEFENLQVQTEKEYFAEFIKQVGDQEVPIKFIYCGIAESLDDLLTAHGSAHRYISSIHLPPIDFTARFNIIQSSADALGITVGEPYEFRIAAISDGFPHYVHLLCEKLYWETYNHPQTFTKVAPELYVGAIASAVKGIELKLKRAYEIATMQKTNDYHEVLWAAADHADLIRHANGIWDSYEKLVEQIEGDYPRLTKKMLLSRLRKLRSGACGNVLKLHNERQGWYEFSENILRGYIRLYAEAQGIQLANEIAPDRGVPMPKFGPPRARRISWDRFARSQVPQKKWWR